MTLDNPDIGNEDDRIREMASQLAESESDDELEARQEAVDEGRDFTPKTTEEGEGEPEPETETTEAKETETQAEAPSTHRVKIDDNDVEVTLDELKAGYLRQSDYTRKTQSVAEEKKTARQEARAEYEQHLQAAASVLKAYQPEKPDTALLDSTSDKYDPDRYHLMRAQWEDHQGRLAANYQQQQRIAQEKATEREKAEAERRDNESRLLVKAIPEWKDEKVRTEEEAKIKAILKNVVKVEPDEIDAFFGDHRNAVLGRLALIGASATDKKAIAEAKVKDAPPVTKPGTAQQGSDEPAAMKQLRAQLKKNPRDDRLRADLWAMEEEHASKRK